MSLKRLPNGSWVNPCEVAAIVRVGYNMKVIFRSGSEVLIFSQGLTEDDWVTFLQEYEKLPPNERF